MYQQIVPSLFYSSILCLFFGRKVTIFILNKKFINRSTLVTLDTVHLFINNFREIYLTIFSQPLTAYTFIVKFIWLWKIPLTRELSSLQSIFLDISFVHTLCCCTWCGWILNFISLSYMLVKFRCKRPAKTIKINS